MKKREKNTWRKEKREKERKEEKKRGEVAGGLAAATGGAGGLATARGGLGGGQPQVKRGGVRWVVVVVRMVVLVEVLVMGIVSNIGRYINILTEISIFYPKRYDKCKNLPDIVLDRHEPIYRHVTDISADIRDEISDISADMVTYFDNNYYFLLERSFYFILYSL